MSFSTDVKQELSKLSNLANKECVKAEMYGYLNSNNVSKENEKIKFKTENDYNINRFSKLLNNLDINKYDIDIIGKNFNITINKKDGDFFFLRGTSPFEQLTELLSIRLPKMRKV